MAIDKLTLDIIEEITLLDGTKYYELANADLNAYAEYAAEQKLIEQVRILKINIPHSTRVEAIEKYIMLNYDMPTFHMTKWIVWEKPTQIQEELKLVLSDNKIG
ncbi:MAG: hypothetical protein LBC17_01290 [Lactobacillaceae bacterium]|jgi:hypothetical protein|nr:hypothetical protein [Lactobacillaceae bacterium]